MLLAVQTQRASAVALIFAPLVAWSLWRAITRQGDIPILSRKCRIAAENTYPGYQKGAPPWCLDDATDHVPRASSGLEKFHPFPRTRILGKSSAPGANLVASGEDEGAGPSHATRTSAPQPGKYWLQEQNEILTHNLTLKVDELQVEEAAHAGMQGPSLPNQIQARQTSILPAFL